MKKPSRGHIILTILLLYLHPGDLRSSQDIILEPISRASKDPGALEVVRTFVVLLMGPQAHPVQAAGHAGADERTHPVNPQMLILVVHHSRAQTPSGVHAAAGDGHCCHVGYRDR